MLALGMLRADYAPFASNPDGRRDVMLCYTSPEGWTLEHFRPYVAWVEAGSGRPLDWFFDAWLMLQYGRSPSGAGYFSGPTVKADWEFFLDEVWSPGRNLDALDRCIEDLSGVLGDPGRPWSLAEGTAVQVEVAGTALAPAEAQRLTDGLWDPAGRRAEGALRCPGGPALIRLDLGRLQAVSSLRLHLWECTWLERLELRTSRDGREWTAVETQEVWGNPVVRGPGSRIVSVPPHLDRHLEIRLHGPADRDLVLDEVIVPPDGNAFWGRRQAEPAVPAEWVLEPPRVMQRRGWTMVHEVEVY